MGWRIRTDLHDVVMPVLIFSYTEHRSRMLRDVFAQLVIEIAPAVLTLRASKVEAQFGYASPAPT